MLEVAYILAGIAVILLAMAIAAWATPLGRPTTRRLNGSAVAKDGHLQTAALLLMAAVGSSAVAAVLAVAEWFAA